jgi:uncharacterized protein YndB with AHSA1/START domain
VTSAPRRAARAVADLSTGVILASVEIDAPPERVFAALTTAEVAQWWGSPETYRVRRWTADLRPGGAWKAEGAGADGKAFSVSGEILEVVPPRLLVQTWSYDWAGGGVTTLRYLIDPIPTGTRVTVRHEGFTKPADAESHERGWEHVLGWLAAHLHGPGSREVSARPGS